MGEVTMIEWLARCYEMQKGTSRVARLRTFGAIAEKAADIIIYGLARLRAPGKARPV